MFALQHVSLAVDAGLVGGLVLLVVLAVMATPFRMLTGWMVNPTARVFLAGVLHAAGDAAGPGSGFGEGFLRQLYGATSTSHSIHVLGIALIGVAVLVATRAGSPTGAPRWHGPLVRDRCVPASSGAQRPALSGAGGASDPADAP